MPLDTSPFAIAFEANGLEDKGLPAKEALVASVWCVGIPASAKDLFPTKDTRMVIFLFVGIIAFAVRMAVKTYWTNVVPSDRNEARLSIVID